MIIDLQTLLQQEYPGLLRFAGTRGFVLNVETSFWALWREIESLVGPQLTGVLMHRAGTQAGMAFAHAFLSQINPAQSTLQPDAADQSIALDTMRSDQPAGKHQLRQFLAVALRDCIAMYQVTGAGRFEIDSITWAALDDRQQMITGIRIRAWDTLEVWMVRQHSLPVSRPVCVYTSGVLCGLVKTIVGHHDVICVERACQSQGAEACLFEVMPVTQVYAGTSDQAVDPVLCLPDATMVATEQHVLETRLKEQTAVLLQANKLLQSQIIERQRVEEVLQETQRILSTLMSNLPGMAYRCRNQDDWMMEFVSEGCLDLTGYQPADLLYNTVVSYASLIHPDDRADVFKTIQEALDAQRPFRCTYRIITATGAEKWVWEQGRGVVSPTGTWMIEGFIIDNTERMRAYHSLEQRVTERTQELGRRREVAEGLRGILTVLNSNRSLEEILTYIVAQACRLLGTNAGAIYRLEGDMLTIQAYQGLPAVYADVKLPFDWGATGKAVAQRQPVAISDTQKFLTTLDSSVIAPHHRPLMVQVMQQFQSLLAVPLVIKEEVYGGITIYHTDIHEFTAEEIDLAVSFADQAALAIENARLREQTERAAAAAERSRLARDLHDAVTQTLFSASLIAEVLPRLWERSPDIGRQRLEELRQLTRGALAEMRTLLLELRPATLTEVGLADLLRQLTEAITGRARVPVVLSVEGQRYLPPDVQVALYRITQEALNNVAKHASASRAAVILRYQPTGVVLHISDDGRGFILEQTSSDSLGLNIMRERAEAIGAQLRIESEPAQGTQVMVVWTDSHQMEEL